MSSKKERKEGISGISISDKNQVIEGFLKKNNLSIEDLRNYLSKKPVPNTVPVSIFKNDKLSALETIVKYLKENKNLKYIEIAKLLNRDQRTIWATYNKASKKMPSSLAVTKSDYNFPIELLKDRTLSVLENIVFYLKTLNLSNHEIAVLLNRNDRTIWTVYNRAKKKNESR